MNDNAPTILSYHCGAMQLSLAFPPETVTERDCSLRRSYGVLRASCTDAEAPVRRSSYSNCGARLDSTTFAP